MQNILKPEIGDVLLNSTGTGTIGRSCVFDSSKDFIVDGHVTLLRSAPDQFRGEWLDAVLRSSWFQNHLERFCYAGSTNQVELSRTELAGTSLPVPSIDEQNDFVRIFNTLDGAIRKTEAIVDKLKQVKQGLLHDLLTRGVDANGELRGQLPASIPFQPLSALAYINPKTTVRLPADAEVSFVPMGATSESGEIVGAELKKWGSVGSGMTLFQEDDVLVAKITPCFENGKGGLAQGLKNGFGFGSTEFHVLRGKPDTHPGFIHYWTISPYFRSQGESHMTGTAGQRRVTTEFFDKFLVPAFGFGEQMLIAKILDAQTNRINAELVELQKLKAQKAGLMEDLLTGRVRVTPLLGQ